MSSTQRRFALLCSLTLCLVIVSIFLDRDNVQNKNQKDALEKQRFLMTLPTWGKPVGLVVVNKAGTFEIAREPASTTGWRLLRPQPLDAEETTAEALLQQVLELQSLGVVGSDPNAKKNGAPGATSGPTLDANNFGFSGIAREVCVRYIATDSNKICSACLETGDINNFDKTLFVRRRGETSLHRVDKSLADALEIDLYGLRDKRLLPLAPEHIVELSVEQKNQLLYRLTRGPKTFTLDGPTNPRADPVMIGSILSALTQMRGARFFDDPNNPTLSEPMGLKPPSLCVTVRDKNGQQVTLSLGRVILKGEAHVFARREDGPRTVASLPSDYAFTQLERSRQDLREKHLLPDLNKDDVASIVVTEPKSRFTLSKVADGGSLDPNTTWQLRAEGEEARADAEAVMAFVAACRALQSERIVREPATSADLRTYQLDKQKREVVLLDKDGRSLGTIYFGKEINADFIALTTDTRTRIDAVTAQMGRILMSPIETFRADRRAALTP